MFDIEISFSRPREKVARQRPGANLALDRET
jgi:hypothetical protein